MTQPFDERGKELLDEAFRRDPYLPWWQVMAFGYYAFYREHYQDAIFWGERIEMTTEKITFLKTASYAVLENYSMAFETLSQGQPDIPAESLLDIDRLTTLFTPRPLALQVHETWFSALVGVRRNSPDLPWILKAATMTPSRPLASMNNSGSVMSRLSEPSAPLSPGQ